tara:strand:+ start:539 stop:889 length:351 start_codon:yes stop_codon:yes gene_type:complete
LSNYEERMAKKYGFFSDESTEQEIKKDQTESETIKESEEDSVQKTSGDNLIVPLEAWQNVLNQLGNIHEANQLMAESRERAAKAEAEAEFLREKLKNTREELEASKKKKRFLFFKS